MNLYQHLVENPGRPWLATDFVNSRGDRIRVYQLLNSKAECVASAECTNNRIDRLESAKEIDQIQHYTFLERVETLIK